MGLTQKLGTIPLAIQTDSSNNVGIGGAANASYKLDVIGNGKFTSSNFPIDIYGTTNNYGLRINSVQAPTLLLYSSNANSSNRNWGIYTNSNVFGDFDIRQSNAKDGDMTVGANSTSRLYIGNTGRVGIGTTTPDTYSGWGGLDVRGGNGGHIIVANSSGTNRGEILTDGNGFNISAFTNNNIAFKTNNTFRAFITNNGIQIDNGELNTPKALWFQANSNTGGNLGAINWYNVQWDGAIRAQIKGETDTGLSNGRLVFSTGGGGVTERMRITSAGNLDFNFANTAATYIQLNQAPSQDGGLVFKRNLANRFQQALSINDAMLFYSYTINANALAINQSGSASLYGTLTQNASDRRLKNNIQNIPNALDKINSINGVTFEWDNTIYKTDKTKDVGIIAQEVQAILPEAVTLAPFDTADDGTSKSGENYLTAYYEKLIPLLIEGIKELSAKVTALENK